MLLVEMQCKGWEHNRVNAGVIELCWRSCPNEAIKLYAEKEHIQELRALIEKNHISICAKEIHFVDRRRESTQHRYQYVEILTNIIEKEENEKKIIILSCNKGIIQATAKVAGKYIDKRFYIVLHSALEEVVKGHRPNMKERMWAVLSRTKQILLGGRTGYRAEVSMKRCINGCTLENCFFVLYAPKYREYLNGKIKQEILNRFIFLHHPLYEADKRFSRQDCKLVVGIYGQAVNQNAYDIIQTYNNKYDNGKVIFLVMAKANNAILGLKNVVRMFEKEHVSNEELEGARKRMDYVLIPYAKNQYRVTASGILCDALSEEIPVLMLDSPLLVSYHSYAIGELCHDIDSMAQTIAEIAVDLGMHRKMMAQYSRAEHELKGMILRDNMKTFRELIG